MMKGVESRTRPTRGKAGTAPLEGPDSPETLMKQCLYYVYLVLGPVIELARSSSSTRVAISYSSRLVGNATTTSACKRMAS
jgi:hypothetical protein